eukprot:EC725657.1.p1 GENE.EC725657.1~~EC725657.1.p1  ORF type:complete len:201 (+),score=21.68 EC725657.1:55-603(+)
MAGRVYRVDHDFTATESVELSVSKGDVVVTVDDSGEQDGWLLVSKRGLPSVRGYVPVSYLSVLPSLPAPTPAVRSSSPPRSTSSPRLASPAVPAGSSVDNYETAFEQHHSYIREVLRRREQTFSRLESAIQAQQRRISDLLDRNSQLTTRIVELDNRIEEERRRWRDAIESEKKAVQQFASS